MFGHFRLVIFFPDFSTLFRQKTFVLIEFDQKFFFSKLKTFVLFVRQLWKYKTIGKGNSPPPFFCVVMQNGFVLVIIVSLFSLNTCGFIFYSDFSISIFLHFYYFFNFSFFLSKMSKKIMFIVNKFSNKQRTEKTKKNHERYKNVETRKRGGGRLISFTF